MDKFEILWKQYETHINLYKFYLEIIIKVNIFHFAISGAIFSFYFANRAMSGMVWSLALPALISISLALLFTFGIYANRVSRMDLFDLRDQLGLKVAPELLVLSVLLGIFAVANLLVFIGGIYTIYSDLSQSIV
ncbi:hypothetical protein [Shewanella scandinavica]|uniref:hypothetical protein n=1 Tax=Shewanella scandinavica TaxID=3063538 RepID=UPI003191EF99